MKPQRRLYRYIFIFISAAIAAAIISPASTAGEKRASQSDVEAVVLPGQIAPRLQNLGDHKFPVTTRSARAQLFINQGLMLAYGFNHAEATRSFREAARLDPDCAMAYWGMALVLGPNINMNMSPEKEPKAFALIQKAKALQGIVSEREKDYIDALSKRYSGDEKPDRPALDQAYAEAMRKLSAKYPDDLDAAALYAESVMDLRPWNYWTRDFRPYPETLEIMAVLESILSRNPGHPGANHYYIHTVEYGRPQLAEGPAETLRGLAPGAGHLVHMPSHIFRRIGRYADASTSNVKAIAADEDYITQCRAQGIYPLAYYPHNIHFLWDSSTMEGRSRTAIDAAVKSSKSIPEGAWREAPLLHQFLVAPLFSYTRFGKWDLIIAQPRPPEDSPFWTGIWRYARGMAFTAKNDPEKAAAEYDALKTIADLESMEGYRVTFSRNGAKAILDIAVEVLAGEMAAKRKNYDAAIARLHRAVLLEDNLIYNEPPDWHVPVRQALGAVLLKAGRPAEAEAIYWHDLKRNPENGWSLYGLIQSLKAQGKEEQAIGMEKRFRKAWSRADITLTASRFMDEKMMTSKAMSTELR